MSTTIYFSSRSVHGVTEVQLQQALDRHGLGQLQSWSFTPHGRSAQTLSIQSSSGQYILKGNPIYKGQWQEEQFFANQISQRTHLPVPSPYILDEQKDIFGWSYLMMPKLTGVHLHEIWDSLPDRQSQAQCLDVLSQALHQLHSWRVDEVGEWDGVQGKQIDLRSEFTPGYDDRDIVPPFLEEEYVQPITPFARWIEQRLFYWLKDAERFCNTVGKEGWQYILEQLQDVMPALERFECPTVVMGDFKSENLLLDQYTSEDDHTTTWRLSGIFDFTTAYFGDPAADLVKIVIMLVDRQETVMAHEWVRQYIRLRYCDLTPEAVHVETEADFIDRLHIHLLYQLILQWGESSAVGQGNFEESMFTHWIRKKMRTLDRIIEKS